MRDEIKRLYDLGFAIHHLRPRSKIPVESKWTTGPRKTWADLLKTFKPNYNVGVRLGGASKIDGRFLAVIDVDIKSTDPRHKKEAYAKIQKLRCGTDRPQSLSGRGNGSGHIYGTLKGIFPSHRLAQSPDIVRVKMPSSDKPSRREIQNLSATDIQNGIRLRPAWEISFMGDGAQVVLPPSIHPDTGRKYEWAKGRAPIASELPQFPESIARVESSGEAGFGLESRPSANNGPTSDNRALVPAFRVEEIDLEATGLDKETVALIKEGENCEDRSAALFSVAMKMSRLGMSDNAILTVLTDPDYFLGMASYDHAKTKSREKAAKWVRRFTLGKAKNKASVRSEFDGEQTDEPEMSDEEAAEFEIEILGQDWRNLLERVKGERSAPRNTLKNINVILTHEIAGPLFNRNEFTGRDYYGTSTPWGGKKGKELTDEDAIQIKLWLAQRFRFEPSTNVIFEAMVINAQENLFHPVRDYFNSLEWDGTERLSTWLKEIMGAEAPAKYLSAVSEKIIMSMIARIFTPGCQFDHIPIFEGKQGVGKSSIPRILAGEWVNETMPDIRDKDAMLNLVGSLIVEISELATLKRADSETYKAFFTRKTDRVRAPYGKRWQEIPRQCIFIGTTNDATYLRDRTGNRRFWPIKLRDATPGEIDRNLGRLRAERDQLFAEGMATWNIIGADLRLHGDEIKEAESIAESKIVDDIEDVMRESFHAFLQANPEANALKLSSLFENGPFEQWRSDSNYHLQLASRALREFGFEKRKIHGYSIWKKYGGQAGGIGGDRGDSSEGDKGDKDEF